MKFVSTRGQSPAVNFKQALFNGLAPDGGLYVPITYPTLSPTFFHDLESMSFLQLSETIMSCYIPELPKSVLSDLIKSALNFPIPLIQLEEHLFLLEVFHGPTLAFKDVGARFMASILSYFLQQESQKLSIIVATSGDTGSAIAHGFYNMPNIDVYILYPSGRISFQQEQQMTTLGNNIHALEVKGTFDDCQELVKTALLDKEIQHRQCVTTANSINIARLLPQIIYHSFGIQQLVKMGLKVHATLVVPSGNFGNLIAAIYSKHLGFPIEHLVAATNLNAIIPHFLSTGQFKPLPSKASFSNAMDVGNPSNFERLSAFYENDIKQMQNEITGISTSDEEVISEIRNTYKNFHYILDPHTAVGVVAARKQMTQSSYSNSYIVTSTAHPAKFPDVIHQALNLTIPLPDQLKSCLERPKLSIPIEPKFATLKKILLQENL